MRDSRQVSQIRQALAAGSGDQLFQLPLLEPSGHDRNNPWRFSAPLGFLTAVAPWSVLSPPRPDPEPAARLMKDGRLIGIQVLLPGSRPFTGRFSGK
jgi:hypothetical protein